MYVWVIKKIRRFYGHKFTPSFVKTKYGEIIAVKNKAIATKVSNDLLEWPNYILANRECGRPDFIPTRMKFDKNSTILMTETAARAELGLFRN